MKLTSGHLTYCSNIYAGERWDEHFNVIKESFPAIKAELAPKDMMAIGLRLSSLASHDLMNERTLNDFIAWLSDNQCYVFTMNGFPFGGFHHTVVKDQVHAPDWTTADRLEYTIRLFHILAELLPDGMDGGVSTSPLTYKPWFRNKEDFSRARRQATANILQIAGHLNRIWQQTGMVLHLDIEPEPDGMLESGQEFIEWFENDLLLNSRSELAKNFKLSPAEAEEAVRRHICLCYDVCHFAIGYEDHSQIISQLAKKDIRTGKIQISAALKANIPSSADERALVINEFSKFNEPTYLHQVIARLKSGKLLRYRDLPEAAADIRNTEFAEWRAHFHVPVFKEDFGILKSTQSDVVQVLELFSENPFTNHLEIETYTWNVLSDELKLPVNQSIIREIKWAESIL